MTDIKDKVIAITGARRGIGAATAALLRRLAADGRRELMGVLHGIAAAMPVFRRQGAGHFVNIASTAGLRVVAGQAVYAATKSAVRALSEGLRVESNGRWRVTIISPGFVRTSFAESAADPKVRARLIAARDRFAIPPEAIARAIAFAIEQPADVDVSEIVVRPTEQN